MAYPNTLSKCWRMWWMILVITSLQTSSGLRILSVLPFPQKSHHIIFNALLEELVLRGHEVTVYSGHRLHTNASNYKHHYISSSLEQHFDDCTFDKFKDSFDDELLISPIGLQLRAINLTEETLSLPKVKALIKSNQTFDVILLETMFAQDAFLGFGYRFNAPVVTLRTLGSFSLLDSVMGNPNPLAYLPSVQLPYNSHMSFLQRVRNFILYLSEQYFSYYHHIPRQEAVMIKHFKGTRDLPLPPLIDLMTNMPVVLLNSQPEVTHVRAFVPNMINVGGLHIPREKKPLPGTIKKFMDESVEGVIYFSLGSSFQGDSLPQYILDAFITTFQNIPERVLWKIDNAPLNISSNVMTVKWAPQTDILGHPKCKAFITHGGLLSLIEATHFGVPLIGIPLFAEQRWNVAKIDQAQIGLRLRVRDISLTSVSSAVEDILQNPMYRRNMQQLSAQMRDRLKESPLDTAVHWVEYVAKHQGAPQLRCPARTMSSFKYFLIDVILFLLSLTILILVCLYILITLIYKGIIKICFKSEKSKIE